MVVAWAQIATLVLGCSAMPLHAGSEDGSEDRADVLPPTVTLMAGYHADIAAFGAGASWPIRAWAEHLAPLRLQLFISADVARWAGRAAGPHGNFLWDVGVTPTLRWHPWNGNALERVFVEGGIGMHLLSRTSINTVREFGSTFQFGERAALGARLDAQGRFEASLFVQHVSNGDLVQPNDGLTMWGATFGIRLD